MKEGNPQLEDGYTRIANELLEKIIEANFNKRELKIILYVLRYSYGFQKKFLMDGANKQKRIVEVTGLYKGDVSKTIKELQKKRVIKVVEGRIMLNKHYKEWQKVSKTLTKKKLAKHQLKVSKTLTKSWQNTNLKLAKHQLTPLTNIDKKTAAETPKEIYKEIYKENIKKENISEKEKQILEKLKSIKIYPYDEEKDLQLIRSIQRIRKVSEKEVFDTVESFALYCEGPYKKKKNKNPRLTLKNFFRNFPYREQDEEKRKGGFYDVTGKPIQF